MKKIALYIPNLMQGGAERAVTKIAEILRENYSVEIILNERIIQYPISTDIICLDIPAGKNCFDRILLTIKRIIALRRIKKENNYLFVMSFLNNANIINILSRTSKTKTVVSVRNYYNSKIYKKSTRFLTTMLNKLYVYADAIVPVTKYIEHVLICSNKKLVGKTYTIYNPFNISYIINESKNYKDSITQEEMQFINNHKYILLFVGRLTKQKGLWNMVKMMKRFNVTGESVGLLVVGEGEQENKIKEFINKNDIRNIFLTGVKKNPYPFFSLAHIFVLSSVAEGFPNVLGEALAVGIPIVSTDCKTGPREILAPDYDLYSEIKSIYYGRYGVLLPAPSSEENWDQELWDDQQLYIAVKELLENEKARKEYSSLGHQRAKDFDYQSVRDSFDEMIKRLDE